MDCCGQTAALVITRPIEGTSTSVARRRLDLVCGLPPGHAGPHRDARHGESWDAIQGKRPTLLRHEDEDPEPP